MTVFLLLSIFLFNGPGSTYAIAHGESVDSMPPVSTAYHRIDRPFVWEEDRPIVAVALAGGGARATANLGVLAALEEAEVPIDFLVGTSMGALIAVMYGSGLPAQQILTLLEEVDPSSLFYLNLPFNRSLLGNDRFNLSLEAILPVKRLEDFPLPTAVLSFDLNEGWRFVQTTGPVAEAIAAPYALQGAFPGVIRDDMFLVDAGTQEASPAWAARLLGADVVITTTAFNELPYDQYDNPVHSWVRIMNLVRSQLSRPVVDAYSDVVIDVDVGRYSFSDFCRSQLFSDIGYETAWAKMPEVWEVLADFGLEPRATQRSIDSETTMAVEQLRRDRLAYPDWIWQPQLVLGHGESAFEPRVFPSALWRSQVGLRIEKGLWDQQFMVDPLQLQLDGSLRYKKLTKEWDGVIAVKADGRETNLLVLGGLQWNGYSSQVQVGAAWGSDHGIGPWAHTHGQTDHVQWDASVWVYGSGTELLADLESVGYGAFRWQVPVVGSWEIAAQGSLDWGRYSFAPKIYRGPLLEDPGDVAFRWQGSAEWIYNWNSEYSRDILNVANFNGLEAFAFADAVGSGVSGNETQWLTGVGAHFSLSLIGLKPSHFSPWVGYDWQAGETRWGVRLQLSF